MNGHKLKIGQKFNRLTSISYAGKNKYGKSLYNFLCDCGVIKILMGTAIKNNVIKSCGCLRKEIPNSKTHGDSKTSEFRIWCAIKSRCYNPKTINYVNYGGRGIMICDAWLSSYETFLKDMGRRPSKDHSIERNDNNGNYEPENCRWATRQEQCNNTRSNVFLEIDGKKFNSTQAALKLGISRRTIANRIKSGLKYNDIIIPTKINGKQVCIRRKKIAV